jgi:hypothetical protein
VTGIAILAYDGWMGAEPFGPADTVLIANRTCSFQWARRIGPEGRSAAPGEPRRRPAFDFVGPSGPDLPCMTEFRLFAQKLRNSV